VRYALLFFILLFIPLVCAIDDHNCAIYGIKTVNGTELGAQLYVRAQVYDNQSNNSLVNAQCYLVGYDGLMNPTFTSDESKSLDTGEVIISHTLSEPTVNNYTAYLLKLSCRCADNTSVTDDMCNDGTTGQSVSFRSCVSSVPYKTGGDKRNVYGGKDVSFIWVVIILPILLGIALMVSAFIFGPQHAVLKIFLFFCPFLCFFVSMQMAAQTLITYYGFDDLVNIIGDTTYWTAFTLFVLISYIIVYVIVALSKSMLSKGKTEFEI
jgi:hypothetical protein